MESNSVKPPPQDDKGYLSQLIKYTKFFCTCITLYGVGYFHLSPSWILFGSITYFVFDQARSRNQRLTSSLKAIGENEKQFITQHFSVRDLPSWVYFPDVERAEWLNKIIKRMWPYISEYARGILIDTVEPAVTNNLPAALKPFKFVTIDLGDTPPRIGGVKVYMDESIRRDEIVMDFDLMLYSDARIKVTVGKVKAGIKEFELRGTLRVLMKPLVPKVPFAGAMTVCFLDSPYINFTLTDMGNLLGLPGLQQTLNTVIRDVVNQLIVLPNRLPLQLVPDVDIQRLKYPLPQGVLRLVLISGRKLKAGDKNVLGQGSSDPYAIIRVGARKFTTAVVKDTLDPVWNEFFETIVDVRRGQSVEVEVFDKDQGNKDDYLGRTSVPVEAIYNRGELDLWAPLELVKTGSVHLKLSWFQMSNKASDFPQAITKSLEYRRASGRSMSAGFLYVSVEQAKNLMRVKQLQEPSAFCNLQLGRDCQATCVKDRTQCPVWNSVHHFLVGDPDVDILQIIVRDSRTEIKLGSLSIPLKQLLKEDAMTVSRPYTLQDSGPEPSTLTLHMQLMALVPGQPQKDIDSTDLEGFIVKDEPSPLPSIASPSTPSPSPKEPLNPDMVIQQRNVPKLEKVPSGLPETPTSPNPSSPIPANEANFSLPATNLDNLSSGDFSADAPMGMIRVTLQYHPAAGHLEVIVHEAKNLAGVDKDGLADPYVKIFLVNQHGNAIGVKKKTKTFKDNLNPVFEENFEFPVDIDQLPLAVVQLDVKNHVGKFTMSGRTHSMGSVCIDLNASLSVNADTRWYRLMPLSALPKADTRSLSD